MTYRQQPRPRADDPEVEISIGAVEGLNNKIRVVTKRSYGFRTFEAMEVALYHTLGDCRNQNRPPTFTACGESRSGKTGFSTLQMRNFAVRSRAQVCRTKTKCGRLEIAMKGGR